MKRGDQPGLAKKPSKQGPATKKKARALKARRALLEQQERGVA